MSYLTHFLLNGYEQKHNTNYGGSEDTHLLCVVCVVVAWA